MINNNQALFNTIKNILVTKREREKDVCYAIDFPTSISIKLTNKCNMRCKHCFEWNNDGYHNFMTLKEQNSELSIDNFSKILEESRSSKSRLYLWGGEPLCHSRFEEIIELLKIEKREINMCTNGTLINRYINNFIDMSDYLELLIPIEGFEKQHDAIRGKGNFIKVIENVKHLISIKKARNCTYKVSIHTVINNQNVKDLFSIVSFFENLGIDFLMLCFPWYISPETCKVMDDYYKSNFSWLKNDNENNKGSWHGYSFRLDAVLINILIEQIKKIKSRKWNISVRFQPDLDIDQVYDFIEDNYRNLYCDNRCLASSMRVEIGPDGTIAPCRFNEFVMGNINNNSLYEIWNGDDYLRFRKQLSNSIMPICPKCNVLYLHSGL